MKPPVAGWTRTRTIVDIRIPDLHGTLTSEIIQVEVDAWKDDEGEVYLDGEATAKMEAIKSRYMGLMTSQQIREVREMLDLTQKAIAHLLQLGQKTWTRWENGCERPSRSMNILLHALMDGHIDVSYLRCRHPDFIKEQASFRPFNGKTLPRQFPTYQKSFVSDHVHETSSISA